MTVRLAHLFFEQSGVFKNEFRKLGHAAFDYDLCDDFRQTDFQVDLFAQIDLAYAGKPSLFDSIVPDDIIIAFFPCTYFCGYNEMYFCDTNYNFRQLTKAERLDKIIERAQLRDKYYITMLKLCRIVEFRRLKMVVENPYNAHHFWRFNFPYKPAVIDMNRRTSGDYFKKPTQYLFINCTPAGKRSSQLDKPLDFVEDHSRIERSLISPDYAHNFICDHILGIASGNTMPTLFD